MLPVKETNIFESADENKINHSRRNDSNNYTISDDSIDKFDKKNQKNLCRFLPLKTKTQRKIKRRKAERRYLFC